MIGAPASCRQMVRYANVLLLLMVSYLRKKTPRNSRFSSADFLKKAKCLNDASLFIFVFIVLCHNELDAVLVKNQKIFCVFRKISSLVQGTKKGKELTTIRKHPTIRFREIGILPARVAELVDAHVSGACSERSAGSSPVPGTKEILQVTQNE